MSTPEVKCRAAEPAKCRHHGTPVLINVNLSPADSIKALLEEVKKKETDRNHIRAEKVVNRALTCDLNWEGKKPSWWKEYAKAIKKSSRLSATPKLIDVIDTPEGRMAVVWQDDDPTQTRTNADSGYGCNIVYFKSFETGEQYAHLRTAYVDEETFEYSFGNDEFTNFRWAHRSDGGGFYSVREYEDDGNNRNLQGKELLQKRREVWVDGAKKFGDAVKDKNGNHVPYYNINESHVPEDDNIVKADLERYSKNLNKKRVIENKYYATPYVDFSRVKEPLTGKGYGTALYIYTARMLATKQQVLRGSSLCSPSAQKTWEGLKKRFPKNAKVETFLYSEKKGLEKSPILDFRN